MKDTEVLLDRHNRFKICSKLMKNILIISYFAIKDVSYNNCALTIIYLLSELSQKSNDSSDCTNRMSYFKNCLKIIFNVFQAETEVDQRLIRFIQVDLNPYTCDLFFSANLAKEKRTSPLGSFQPNITWKFIFRLKVQELRLVQLRFWYQVNMKVPLMLPNNSLMTFYSGYLFDMKNTSNFMRREHLFKVSPILAISKHADNILFYQRPKRRPLRFVSLCS